MNYLRKNVPSKIFDWCLNMLPVLYNRFPGTFPKFFKTFFFLLYFFHCTFFFFQSLIGFLIFMKILSVPYFSFCTSPINDTIFKTLKMFCWPLVFNSLKKNPSQYCFYYMTWSLYSIEQLLSKICCKNYLISINHLDLANPTRSFPWSKTV